MGAFAAAIGGFGDAAGRYAEQMRGLLEQRREGFANMLSQAAQVESDPTTRAALLQHSADLLSGKPIGKITQAFAQTMSKRQADDQALLQAHQMMGGTLPGAPPPPQPGSGPGTVPGNPVPTAARANLTGQPEQGPGTAPFAAQIAGNPVQPTGQPIGAPVPAPPQSTVFPPELTAPPSAGPSPAGMPELGNLGMPTPQDPIAIMQKYLSDPRWGAPANREVLRTAMTQELTHNEALRQTLEQQQATLAYKQAALKRLKATPVWDKLPDITKAQYEAESAGMSAAPMATSLMLPHMISTGTLGSQAPQGTLEYGTNQPVKGDTRYRVMFNPLMPPGQNEMWMPETAQTAIETTPEGNRTVINKQVMGQIPGVAASAFVLPRGVGATAAGNPLFQSFTQMQQGTPPLQGAGTLPSFAPRETTALHPVPTQDASGNPITKFVPLTSVSQRGGGAPKSPGAPASLPGVPQLPGNGMTFPKPLSGGTQTMKEAAPKVLELADKVDSLVTQQEKSLGPLASRWQDFMTSRVGAPNPEFTKLKDDSLLLESLLMRMHTGRGSEYMLQHFQELMSYAKQSPANMHAAIGEIKAYAKTVQQESSKDLSGGGTSPIAPVPGAPPRNAQEFMQKYGINAGSQ